MYNVCTCLTLAKVIEIHTYKYTFSVFYTRTCNQCLRHRVEISVTTLDIKYYTDVLHSFSQGRQELLVMVIVHMQHNTKNKDVTVIY